MMLALSNVKLKAIDRQGGAYLALPWPAGMAEPIDIAQDEERKATSAQHLAAARMIGPICAQHNLIHLATLESRCMQPHDYPGGITVRPVLLAHVVTPRWQRGTTPGNRGRILWLRGLFQAAG